MSLGRQCKQGLNYFTIDVHLDDKFELIEAKYNLEGFAIIIKLFAKVYDNGYWYKWGEKEGLLFSNRINVDINTINAIIKDCLRWELFSSEIFEQYGVLTSSGIQKRYFDAVKRRKRVEIIEQYLLVNPSDFIINDNIIINNVNIKPQNANKNAQQTRVTRVTRVTNNASEKMRASYGQFINKHLWPHYPSRKGTKGSKKTTLDRMLKHVKLSELKLLKKAAINYALHCTSSDTFPKDAERFIWNQDSGELWREWVDYKPMQKPDQQSLQSPDNIHQYQINHLKQEIESKEFVLKNVGESKQLNEELSELRKQLTKLEKRKE